MDEMVINKDKLVQRAVLTEQVKRYHDMAAAMKAATETGMNLSKNEVKLLSIAYNHLIEARRSSWRVISEIEQKTEGSERKQQMASEYRQKVEREMTEICYEVLGLLDTILIPRASNAESKVFYLKMKGDYYRYLVEIAFANARSTLVHHSQKAYQEAFEISKSKMGSNHPFRLGLALNFSIFYDEILNSQEKACQLVKQAFDEAIAELESLDDDSYEDSTLIMQLLQDKLKVWTSDKKKDGEEVSKGAFSINVKGTQKELKKFATEEQLERIFSNGVISDCILSSLSFTDLKSLREVSTRFQDMIESYKRFKKGHLLISNNNIQEIISTRDRKLLWENLRILPLDKPILAVSIIQSHLAEVKIIMRNEFPIQFLHKIKDCANLKKLYLKAKRIVNGGEEITVDWSFLGQMNQLKDFQLTHPKTSDDNWQSYGYGTLILESLPRNQLERLSLRGIGSERSGFWRVGGGEPELAKKLELLRGFRNLKVLSLQYCSDSVDDEVMHFVNKEITSLEVLEISHSSNLTDVAFHGILKDGSDSIQNLTKLKQMSIRLCHSVTSEGLISSLRLPSLKSFEYLERGGVPTSFVCKLMSQNPLLESISVRCYSFRHRILQEVNNPRLKTLIYLRHMEDHEDTEEDADSDEDAEIDDSDEDAQIDDSDEDAEIDDSDEDAEIDDSDEIAEIDDSDEIADNADEDTE